MVNWHIRVAVLLILLALSGCSWSGQTRYAPNPPGNDGDMQEHGSGDSGGGGSGM